MSPHFSVSLPWWGYALAFGTALLLAWLAYQRVAVPLARPQRALLTAVRAITLLLIVALLLRPVREVPIEGARDSLVALLVDVSRSMRLADDGQTRMDRARALVQELERQIAGDYQTEILSFGEALTRTAPEQLVAAARRSDLSGALAQLADRYRGRPLAGVIVLSDGGDTATTEAGSARGLDVPVFTVGLGQTEVRDREIVNLTAGDPAVTGASVDLSVSATSHGFESTPMVLRLTESGRPLETRRVTPPADGSPVHEVFTVSPSADRPSVYAVEIPVEPGESVEENNTRQVLIPAERRRRRVLIVEGAPGFEHTFLKRALSRDPALEVDAVVRKGQNEDGRDTFFIQAAASRAGALATGFPPSRAALFLYDALMLGNVAGDFFTREQLQLIADFVSERGGGLVVLGARSFEGGGLAGTPLEEVLPLDITDRRPMRLSAIAALPPSTAALTDDGALHPVTRIALTASENRQRWSELPALASVAAAGAPRAGAQVLAVGGGTAGELRPLVATQRYGLGRVLVFTGEASWRWRMLRPASDTTHETLWRQFVRWTSAAAAGPIEIGATAVALPGTTEAISVLVRDPEFKPIGDAEVAVRIREPGGQERGLRAALADPRQGRYTATVRFDQSGVYTVTAEVRRGGGSIGVSTRPLLVGGSDLEMSDPRLNASVLERIAATTGGRYVRAADAGQLPALLRESGVGATPTELRDLWHTGWMLALIVGLLTVEWFLRRRVGLK